MITISIRETVKVKNHELCIRLPETFNCDEVDVIIFPRMEDVSWDVWQGSEIERIGRIGCSSRSFVEDPEDYSKW